jgi:hypothetical protein
MAEPLVYLILSDPIRTTDPPEVAEIKAAAALEDWAALLRARGERVTLLPYKDSPVASDGAA